MSRKGNKARGLRYQQEARAILEKHGYLVEVARPLIKWVYFKGRNSPRSMGGDFFQRFDLIAIQPNFPVRLIQVGVWEDKSHKEKQIEGFPLGDHWRQEIWLRKKGRPAHFRCHLKDDMGFLDLGIQTVLSKPKKRPSTIPAEEAKNPTKG